MGPLEALHPVPKNPEPGGSQDKEINLSHVNHNKKERNVQVEAAGFPATIFKLTGYGSLASIGGNRILDCRVLVSPTG